MRSSTFPESCSSGSSAWPWSTPAWIDSRSPASSSVSSTVRASGGSDLHRGLDVDDRLERLVVDDDRLRAVLRGRLGLADDERDRLAREDDLLARERLRRAVRAGRRDREVGRREHGDDARDGESSASVDAANPRVRLGRQDGARMQQTVDVAVGRVPRRARHLVRRVDPRAGDADHRVAHRSPFARLRERSRARARRAPWRARGGTPPTRSGRRRSRRPERRSRDRRRGRTASRRRRSTPPSRPSGPTSAAAPTSAKPDAGCSTEA